MRSILIVASAVAIVSGADARAQGTLQAADAVREAGAAYFAAVKAKPDGDLVALYQAVRDFRSALQPEAHAAAREPLLRGEVVNGPPSPQRGSTAPTVAKRPHPARLAKALQTLRDRCSSLEANLDRAPESRRTLTLRRALAKARKIEAEASAASAAEPRERARRMRRLQQKLGDGVNRSVLRTTRDQIDAKESRRPRFVAQTRHRNADQ